MSQWFLFLLRIVIYVILRILFYIFPKFNAYFEKCTPVEYIRYSSNNVYDAEEKDIVLPFNGHITPYIL